MIDFISNSHPKVINKSYNIDCFVCNYTHPKTHKNLILKIIFKRNNFASEDNELNIGDTRLANALKLDPKTELFHNVIKNINYPYLL